MNAYKPLSITGSLFTLIIVVMVSPSLAIAHCDALDGPVVTLARKALDIGNVNLVLPWVPSDDVPAIRQAFDHTQSVRKLGAEAKLLADTFFLETLVRVHRASEGAPYAGLKPAGLDLGPAIPAADKALDTGSIAAVEKLLTNAIRKGLRDGEMGTGMKLCDSVYAKGISNSAISCSPWLTALLTSDCPIPSKLPIAQDFLAPKSIDHCR